MEKNVECHGPAYAVGDELIIKCNSLLLATPFSDLSWF